MARTFYSLMIVFVFYAIWGLHLFSGVNEYRCRKTPTPILNHDGTYIWEMIKEHEFLCGYWSCPEGSHCGSPADYDLPFDEEELNIEYMNYGYTKFSNFFEAMLTVIHFFSISSWSSINYTVMFF